MNTNSRPGRLIASARNGLILMTALVALAGCAQRDLTEVQQFVENTKRTTPIKKPDPPPEIKPYTPFAYTAQGIKDPFLVAPFAQEEELEMTREAAAVHDPRSRSRAQRQLHRRSTGSKSGQGRT